ncbi:hypothetical protein ACGF13_14255 [Kitasatospora sp. NPDC048286]|uniref:hypothetical protein n=1 Tax=Kitasatospora sp. NPDC048286 TaxID=3364047 RepID=UPI00371736E9
MTETAIRSRGSELLHGEFAEYAADIACDVAKENPGFSPEYVGKLITAWGDWATLVADQPNAEFALTVDMDEVWHASVLRTRKYVAFMGALTGGRFIHHDPEPDYGKPGQVRRTVAALESAGFEVDHEVWGETVAATCNGGNDCKPAAPCPDGVSPISLVA